MVGINPAGFAPVSHVPASLAVSQRAATAAAAATAATSTIAASTAATSTIAASTAATTAAAATSTIAASTAATTAAAATSTIAASTVATTVAVNEDIDILREMIQETERVGSSDTDVLAVYGRLNADTQNLVKEQVWKNFGSPLNRGDDFGGDTVRATPKDEHVLAAVKTVLEGLTAVTTEEAASTTAEELASTTAPVVSKGFFEAVMGRVSNFFSSIVSCVTGSLTGFANWIASWFSPAAVAATTAATTTVEETNFDKVVAFQRDVIDGGDAEVIKAHFATLPEAVQFAVKYQIWVADGRRDYGTRDFGSETFESAPAGELVKAAVAAVVAQMEAEASAPTVATTVAAPTAA